MLRVIFLDFDGVLHPVSALSKFEPSVPIRQAILRATLFRWAWILDEMLEAHPEVGIVVHSNWRLIARDEELQSFLGPLARRFAGSTPHLPSWPGIRQVVQQNHLRDFRILDDRPMAFPSNLPELIACNPEIGLKAHSVCAQLDAWLCGGVLEKLPGSTLVHAKK